MYDSSVYMHQLIVFCLFTDFIIRFGVMALKALVAATLHRILPTKRKVCCTVVTEVCFILLVSSIAAGQILHVVRVCLADVPVTHTSPLVV